MAEVEPFDQFAVSVARESWDVFRRDPVLFVIAGMVYLAVAVVTLGLLAGPMQVAFIDMVRKVRAGEPVAVSALFSRMDALVSSSVAMFLFMVLFWVGLCLLVLPGLLVLLFFAWSLPAIAFERIGGVDSLRRSYALVRANLMQTLALLVMISVANVLGSMIIFGFILTLPLATIALTLGYERLASAPTLVASDPYARG